MFSCIDRADRRLSSNSRQNNQSSSSKSLTVMHLFSAYFEAAIDYRSYCLTKRSQHYDHDVARHIAKMENRLEVQVKSHMFHESGRELI